MSQNKKGYLKHLQKILLKMLETYCVFYMQKYVKESEGERAISEAVPIALITLLCADVVKNTKRDLSIDIKPK